jgi:hypothetical protein
MMDSLKTAGFDVKLANQMVMKRYDALKYSDDRAVGLALT